MHTFRQYKVIILIDLLVLKVKIYMTKRERAIFLCVCGKVELYPGQVILLSIKYYTFSPKSDFHNLLQMKHRDEESHILS